MTPNAPLLPYDFVSYRDYLQACVSGANVRRGFKSALAEAIGCRLSYLSQVLGGKAELSLEQGLAAGVFFKLSPTEQEYLLLLLQRDRAGTPALRRYFDKKLTEALAKHQRLADRLDVGMPLSSGDQSTYYSSWQFAAVHVASSLPKVNSPDEMAAILGLPKERARQIVSHLAGMGLVAETPRGLTIGKQRLHLAQDDIHVVQHHTNWRLNAIRNIELQREGDLFYSSVVTLSRRDFQRLREDLTEAIARAKKLIRDSPEEMVAAFHVDLYDVAAR